MPWKGVIYSWLASASRSHCTPPSPVPVYRQQIRPYGFCLNRRGDLFVLVCTLGEISLSLHDERNLRMNKHILMMALLVSAAVDTAAQEADSLQVGGPMIHRVEADVLPSIILHTNQYLRGNNPEGRTMNHAFTARLKYAFQRPQDNERTAVYKGAYQGVGVAYHDFNRQLGNPVSAFIFQGARIVGMAPRVSLNYEWNLGLTFGWHPFDVNDNPENKVIGSKVTAYIDVDLYLRWQLADCLDVNLGGSITHFSNGNTTIPNAGLNVLGGRVSVAYYVNRRLNRQLHTQVVSPLRRHVDCDLVLYGAWRKQGFYFDQGPVALPGSYGVFGFTLNPLYHLNHWFNAGVSVDGVYDRSANLYFDGDYIVGEGEQDAKWEHVRRPAAIKQMALGLSARAEFVMPYFTINLGYGHNIVNARGGLKGWYQMLALKVGLSRRIFANIGYSLHDFKYPNHLMLGAGVHL